MAEISFPQKQNPDVQISFPQKENPDDKLVTHVGPVLPDPSKLRDLTDVEKARYAEYNYVKYEEYQIRPSPSVMGRFYTQAQLDGACGKTFVMKTGGRIQCPHCNIWCDSNEFINYETKQRLC